MFDYDAIIIGSGNNGLVCALYLAKLGVRVLVIEQAAEVGGAARSAQVTLPGFTHDLFATNFTLFTASPAYRDFQQDIAALGINFLSNDRPYASGYDGRRAARVYTTAEETEQELGRFSSQDVAGWRDTVAFYTRTAPRFLPLYSTMMPSMAMLRQLGRIVGARPSDTFSLGRLLFDSPRQFVERHFKSLEVKSLFTPWSFHLDYGPDVKGGAAFAFISSMSAHLHGIKIVEGGAGRLFGAVRTLIEQHGGKVMTNSRVVGIEVRHNTAVGVRLADGQIISASQAVVANIAPQLLFGELVKEELLPTGFYRRISRFRHAVGTFVVHLALRSELKWKAGEDLATFNYVHLFGTPDEIAKSYSQGLSGYLPAHPMLIVSQTTSVDPSRAPAGHHVIRIHARAFPSEIRGDAAGKIESKDWQSAREAIADRLIDMLAEHAPNVHSAMLGRYIMSPLDLERSNPNLIHGDCNGGSHHINQYYLARPAIGWSRYSTPIKRLYMIGASQWPGSGINGISGRLLAKRLVEGGLR